MGTVKSVNDGRPGAEQTEAEGTGEGDIQNVREESSLLNIIDSHQSGSLLCIFNVEKDDDGVVTTSITCFSSSIC